MVFIFQNGPLIGLLFGKHRPFYNVRRQGIMFLDGIMFEPPQGKTNNVVFEQV